MKLNLQSKKTISSEGLTHTKMGLDEESSDMITYYLRDKIYTNKVLAPVREYICNAIDAHVEFGINKDVDVSFINNVFKVRDYGLGLDEDDIRNVFGKYGKSSKRDTEKQVGAFGVGAMSGFSYSDTFYVNSYHNGIKTSYVCTLGAGDFGVSVGEIYEVSQEPTTEQGMEISIEVIPKDKHNFNFEAQRLVQSFLPDAKLQYTSDSNALRVVRPQAVTQTVTIGEYVISGYQSFNQAPMYGQSYLVRMGGVIYPYSHKDGSKRSPSKTIVVDVPIGKLTVPISREHIEDTAANERVFKEIDDALDAIAKEELSVLTPPNFGNVCSKNESYGNNYNGKWFTYPYRETFPMTTNAFYLVHKCKNEPSGNGSASLIIPPMAGTTDTFAIYLFPDIKSNRTWHQRLQKSLTDLDPTNYAGYMWMNQKNYDDLLTKIDSTIDISKCKFIDIKTLTLAKLDKVPSISKTKYIVYSQGYKKYHAPSDYYSAQSLNDYIIEHKLNKKVPKKDWYKHTKNEEELNIRTIGDRKAIGTSYDLMTVNSQKMIDDLKTLGWLTPTCPEYIAQKQVFADEAKHQSTLREIEYRAKKLIFTSPINSRTIAAIKSNPSRLALLESIKAKITSENSTRARIFRALGYNAELKREDVRSIMRLKH